MFKEVDYNKHFVIGTPLVPWKVQRAEHMAWLADIQEIRRRFPNVVFFTALEMDNEGITNYGDFIDKLHELGVGFWAYYLNDGEAVVTSQNRWIRIEMGRNLVREYAQRARQITGHHWGENADALNEGVINHSAVLYVDSDMIITADLVEKLLEVDHPLVSADVPAYGLHGKVISENPRIEEHWNTAGCLLVNAPAYYDLVWSHNNYLNLSDDPTFQSHSVRLLRREGVETFDDTYGECWVRKDVVVRHIGELIPVENRGIPNRF